MTLPLFVYMGYMLSESGIADDLYQMFHVWMGSLNGGLAIGTIGLMVVISAMNEYRSIGHKIRAEVMPGVLSAGYVVAVAGLMIPNALIEIAATAAID